MGWQRFARVPDPHRHHLIGILRPRLDIPSPIIYTEERYLHVVQCTHTTDTHTCTHIHIHITLVHHSEGHQKTIPCHAPTYYDRREWAQGLQIANANTLEADRNYIFNIYTSL